MLKRIPTPLTFAFLCVVSGAPILAAPTGDSLAEQIANAYGGMAAWRAVPLLGYDFVVVRDGQVQARCHHLWDRRSGDHRYEVDSAVFARLPFFDEQSQQWRPLNLNLPPGRLVGLVNEISREGRVWINDQEQPPAMVERVLQRVDNDSYWLLLPFKLEDPGTNLFNAGPATLADGTEAVEVSVTHAPDIGESSDDLWELFLDSQTHRILRTTVDLQDSGDEVQADWRGEQTVGGVTFATERVSPDKTIRFERLATPEVVPPEVFTDPSLPWQNFR
jgi:hypothetical protein